MTGAAQLAGFLAEFEPSTAQLARRCLAFVRRLAPGALERVYDAYSALAIGFATGDSLRETFIHVAVYPRHVNIGFNQGAALGDPARLLVGTGSSVRHVRVDDAARLADPRLAALVSAAAEKAGHAGRPGERGAIRIVRIYARRRPRR
jgi:hypothetical protein